MSANKSKYPVAVHLVPSLDTLELVKLDDTSGEIDVACSIPVIFDPLTRQCMDMGLFDQAIRDLFNANRIPWNTPTIFILPSFFTREADFPQELSKDEVSFALVSEAERFHVFKNVEPQIGWHKTAEGRYLYSAYPKIEIERIVELFSQLKIPLKQIELNYCSILRGLLATGTIAEDVAQQSRWIFVVLADTNVFLALMEGVQFIKVADTPLSTQAGLEDSLADIRQDYDAFVEGEDFSKLVLVNNATKFASDNVLSHMSVQVPVASIEQNAETLTSRGAANGNFPCTLESVGAVFHDEFRELPSVNFKPHKSVEFGEVEEIREKAFKTLLAVGGLTYLLIMVFWGILWLVGFMKDQELQGKMQEASKLSKPAEMDRFDEVQRKLFVKKILEQDVQVSNAVVKIGKVIGNDLWLNKLLITTDLKEDVQTAVAPVGFLIDGQAMDSNQVGLLWNELKRVLARDDLGDPTIDEKHEGETTTYHWVISAPKDNPPKDETSAEG